jgi:ATP-dependent helicase/nuclease subunit B
LRSRRITNHHTKNKASRCGIDGKHRGPGSDGEPVIIGFGLWADGRTYPEHAAPDVAAAGAPVLGPQGLLDVLETGLGLSGPRVSEVERVASWQAKLEASGTRRFWTRSLEADSWSTARRVLQMRDDLIEAGWRGGNGWREPRLADIAVAEAAGDVMAAGLADRLSQLFTEADTRIPLFLSEIRLVEARAELSIGWRRLCDRLEALGVTIQPVASPRGAEGGSALSRAQRWITSNAFESGGQDESIVEITADTELAAAEALAAWCGTALEEGKRHVVIAQGGDSQILDHALALHGEPRAGLSAPSPYRGVLQVLPLAFQLAWAPLNVQALLTLLCLPRPPIPRNAAAKLARALEKAPGVGGPEWRSAWEEIEVVALAASDNDVGQAAVRERLARWHAWVEPVRADPVTGLTLAQAMEVCDRVIAWAVAMHATTSEDCYLVASQLAKAVRDAFLRLQRPMLSRSLVERVIDQAVGGGVADVTARPEAGAWRSVAHPGAVWADVDTVIWWNFNDTDERPRQSLWTAAERAELAAADVIPNDPAAAARLLARAWEQPVLCARRQLVLVRSTLQGDGEAPIHPLAHRLAPVLEIDANKVSVEDSCHSEKLRICSHEIVRDALTLREAPLRKASWPASAAFSAMAAGRVQSATSLENLFSCQFRWALQHVARLRPGRMRSLPDYNQLMGNLAHAMAREIFQPGPPAAPDDAARQAAALFDRLLDEIAAPLRDTIAAADLSLARLRLPEAMAALSRTLTQNGLEVVACEHEVTGAFGELTLQGSIDLVARDGAGRLVVIDLKWTRAPAVRRNEVEAGGAVQLATYAAMLNPSAAGEGGYFLLNQRDFVVPIGGRLQGRAVLATRNLAQTWAAVLETWADLAANVATAGLVATGVEGGTNHLPPGLALQREVRCDLCDYATLCRVRTG